MVPGHCGNVSSVPFRFTFCGRCPGSWDQVGVVFFRFFVRPRQTGTTLSAFYSSADFGEVQRIIVGFEVGWGLREFQRNLKGFEVFVQHMCVNRLRPVRPRRDDLVGPNTLLLCSTDVRCEGILVSSLVPGHCGNASSVPFRFNGRCFSSGDQHRSPNGATLSTFDICFLPFSSGQAKFTRRPCRPFFLHCTV